MRELFCVVVDGIEGSSYLSDLGILAPASPPPISTHTANEVCSPRCRDQREPSTAFPPTPQSIARYGLPGSPSDVYGLRDLREWISCDFSPDPGPKRHVRRRIIYDSDSDCSSNLEPTHHDLVQAAGLPPRWVDEDLIVRQFVDDLSGSEKHPIGTGIMTLSKKKCKVEIHASKCQLLFETVAKNARGIGMKINAQQTYARRLPLMMMSTLSYMLTVTKFALENS